MKHFFEIENSSSAYKNVEWVKQENLFDSPKKLQRATMANLSDDLILEIIARLPLRHAIQCMLLNKTFFHRISASFQRHLSPSCRSSNTSICYYSGNILTRLITPAISSTTGGGGGGGGGGRISQVSTTVSLEPKILASCNGVLLLYFFHYSSCYVFNPITGAIVFVDHPHLYWTDVGLAVDLDAAAAKNFQFKLVTVQTTMLYTERGYLERIILRFNVHVPSSSGINGGSCLLKSSVEFGSAIFVLYLSRAVYVHGCLHWILTEGREIVVFDVEREEARIINGPFKDKDNKPGFHLGSDQSWFGNHADGSLRFVYTTLDDETVIQSHDYVKDEWRVTHKIAYTCIPNNDDLIRMKVFPLFFDGRRLFLQVHTREESGVVLMHDVLTDEWEKTAKIGGIVDCKPPFFSFFPTLAKVSDKYLHNYNTEFPSRRQFGVFKYTEIKHSFEGLQRLLTTWCVTKVLK